MTWPARLWRNERGNVLMIFVFALIPMLVAVGVAVDYSQAARSRTHLSAAADAAALAGARAAQDYLDSYGTGSVQWQTASEKGTAAANAVFAANQNQTTDPNTFSPTAIVKLTQASDGTALATVTASANTKTYFMYLVGIPTVPISVPSQAQGAGVTYYQVVFIVDNSNSMAIGGDDTAISSLENDWMFNSSNYTQKCAFACHDSNATVSGKRSVFCARVTADSTLGSKKDASGTKYSNNCTSSAMYCPKTSDPNYTTYGGSALCLLWDDKRALAKLKNYKLKIDYVKDALDSFMDQMSSTKTKAFNQFQISMWTFGTTTNKVFSTANYATTTATQSAYYALAKAAADNIDLENSTIWSSSNVALYNHGYTKTSDALTTIYNDSVKNLQLGDGSSPTSRKTFFIFLSDGAEDVNGSSDWNRIVKADYPSICTTMKNPIVSGSDKTRPIVFSIEAKYPDVPSTDADYKQYSTLILNSNMKTQIPTAMQNCATPGNYLLAQNGDEIVQAVQKAFASITSSLHLTK